MDKIRRVDQLVEWEWMCWKSELWLREVVAAAMGRGERGGRRSKASGRHAFRSVPLTSQKAEEKRRDGGEGRSG